jgi:hypothetical protein
LPALTRLRQLAKGRLMSNSKKKIFISYSGKDKEEVLQIREAIPKEFEVWIDEEETANALTGSDYYVLVISENPTQSQWVIRELSYAFELAIKKRLSIVPLLLKQAEIPFELRGLLYIDARGSLSEGIEEVAEFFNAQIRAVSSLGPPVAVRKSTPAQSRQLACSRALGNMELGDLRFHLSDRLGLRDVEAIWFDTFGRQMRDEVNVENPALALVELLDRSRREDLLSRLVDIICRNKPKIAPT